nr:DUF2764 family protein [Thiocapsa imhoffii]
MLLGSLPYHGPLFGAKQTPVSRIQLNQRLGLLRPDEAGCLRTARALIEWSQQETRRSDAAFLAHARARIDALQHPFVRELVIWRLELRTLVAALRRRHRGESAPLDQHWGYGRWVELVRRHWNEPAFGLDVAFPWLPQAQRHLDRGESLDLERLLGTVAWNHLERVSDGHHFDFEAVVVYVMRWDMIASWTGDKDAAALERFDALVANAMRAVEQQLMQAADTARP